MIAQTASGLYVPRHTIIDPTEKPIKITVAHVPDHHITPLTVIRKSNCTLLVEHEGTSAEDMIISFLEQMYRPELRQFFVLWTPRPLGAILTDWRRELADLMHLRALDENIPAGARWT